MLLLLLPLQFRGHTFNAVDTPGHADFGGEVERWVGGWVGGWVGNWLAGWLAGCLTGWLAGRRACMSRVLDEGWLAGCLWQARRAAGWAM